MAGEVLDKATFDAAMQDITARITAAGLKNLTEEKVKEMITTHLSDVLKDETFIRKMRFGGDGTSPKLVGTKYQRWGLSIADIEFLFDLQESLQGLKRVSGGGVYPGPSDELRNTFEAISEAIYLPMDEVKKIDQRAIDDLFPRIPLGAFYGKDRILAKQGKFELTQAYQNAIRAMDTAETGYGLQLIGAQYVSDLWAQARGENLIFGLLDSFEMTAPVAYVPVETNFPEMLYYAESATSSDSAFTTSKTGSNRVAITAYKFIIHQMWSGEMEEDSIIPFIPFLRRQLGKSTGYYPDSLVLNGDMTNAGTGNINLDDADPADTKHYLALDGLRHVGIVDNTNNQKDLAGAITLAALAAVKGRMLDSTYKADWGHPINSSDLVYVADPETADRISMLDEVLVWYQLQGKKLLTGQVAEALGHPVISSIAQPKTEADGKVSTTAGNNTKGQVTTFNRNGYKVGWRRRVKLETERIPATDQSRLVLSLRMGLGRFSPTGAASGIESADVIYDITL